MFQCNLIGMDGEYMAGGHCNCSVIRTGMGEQVSGWHANPLFHKKFELIGWSKEVCESFLAWNRRVGAAFYNVMDMDTGEIVFESWKSSADENA